MRATPRIVLEDVLACWRAAISIGAGDDPAHAAELTRAIFRDAAVFRLTPDARSEGDRSIASAANRFRARAGRSQMRTPSLSNADELNALAAVAAALSDSISCANAKGAPMRK